MPDLYTQIANGTYGRSRDRWQPEPDFDDITVLDDEDNDGEDADYSALEDDLEGLL